VSDHSVNNYQYFSEGGVSHTIINQQKKLAAISNVQYFVGKISIFFIFFSKGGTLSDYILNLEEIIKGPI